MSGVPELGSKQQTKDFASRKQVEDSGGAGVGVKDGQDFLRDF